jgi:hypothetical protein
MKLQEFVNGTLREIIAGVKEAQAYAKENGGVVNPGHTKSDNTDTYSRSAAGGVLSVTKIDFDVAVTSTDTSETQAGAGIFVAALGFGVKDKSDTVNSCVSRIKFSVPLVLPVNKPE